MTITRLELTYKGQKIHVKDDLICLTDFWEAVDRPKNKSAPQWLNHPQTVNLILRLQEKMGKSNILIENHEGIGTFGHWHVALAYAKYLSTDLEMHINEIYMRYKSGDVTLADQIADRASPEAQAWLLKRIYSKVKALLGIEHTTKQIEEKQSD